MIKITQEMENQFTNRTKKHINFVVRFYEIYYTRMKKALPRQDLYHDVSKFKEPERTPYIYITWNYYCKDRGIAFELTPELNKVLNMATNHHVKNNGHHPEFWYKNKEVNLIPLDDRDKFDPSAIPTIVIPYMDHDYMVEMCADWCAMSKEKGTNPFDWANKVLGKRWKFPPDETKEIYEILKVIWH